MTQRHTGTDRISPPSLRAQSDYGKDVRSRAICVDVGTPAVAEAPVHPVHQRRPRGAVDLADFDFQEAELLYAIGGPTGRES